VERYARIETKLPREFLLLQGTGCFHKACRFCHYWHDVSEDTFAVNAPVLTRVTGEFGILDVINSGSIHELEQSSMELLQSVVRTKPIHTLWFEAHYSYRHRLDEIRALFPGVTVKFRTGVESFDSAFRDTMNKNMPHDTPEEIRKYFDGVCLLVCVEGQTKEQIRTDTEIAAGMFEYFSVNVFCENTTDVRLDRELLRWFRAELQPSLEMLPHCEILIDNTDLGVG